MSGAPLGSTPPLALSVDDLGWMFEPRHAALAGRLREVAGEIEAMTAPAAEVAAALGARFGLYRLLAPGADGRLDARGICLAREMLGWASPLADAIFAVQGLASYTLIGTAAAQALGEAIGQGRAIGGFALTEPEAGSDVAAIATRAVREGDGWRLDGVKTFISNAGIATFYAVFASTDPSAGRRGLTAFFVPADAEGLEVEAIAIGDHPIGRLTLRGVRLAGDAALGPPGGGFALAMATLDRFRVTVGAAAVGMARRALAEAIGHVTRRRQFGQRLADQQLVQAHLADMATELDAARLLVLRAAHALDRGEPAGTAVSMAKLYATEAAQRIVDAAVQLHGGLGVCDGAVVERLYRAVRPLRIYEGTSEIQRLLIGRALVR